MTVRIPTLVANHIPEQFPRLRFGFIEAGASWVPYVLHNLKRQFRVEDDHWGPRYFAENRIFIACEANEDLPYLMQYIGEDQLIIGSDYGHNDPSEEAQLVATIGWHGLDGDRRFAFRRIGDASGFPWLSASKLPVSRTVSLRKRSMGFFTRSHSNQQVSWTQYASPLSTRTQSKWF